MFNFERNIIWQLRSGFTLIEVIVALCIFLLIGLTILSFQKDIFVINMTLSDSIATQTEIRKLFKSISSEIRSASISSTGGYPIAYANATNFTFYSDIDNDGFKERVRYFVDNDVLKKGIIKPSGNPLSYNSANEVISIVINNLINDSQPVFEYYDSSYDGSSLSLSEPIDLLAIRLVKITVKVDKNPSRPPGDITMITHISIRNLKNNF